LRCVFDSNVLISALLLPDSKPRRALDLAFENGEVLLSFALLAELYEVLSRRQFRRYVDEEDIRTFLDALTRETQWVEPTTNIKVCRDPDDDKILDLAVSGEASCIVTGDSDLLVLHPFQGIPILSPSQFLNLIHP
jgi:putative PIN family toxin of toxin-antitoxin system